MEFYKMLDDLPNKGFTKPLPYLKKHRPEVASLFITNGPISFQGGVLTGMMTALLLVQEYGLPSDLDELFGERT